MLKYKRYDQEVTENSLSMWDTALPWAPQRLVQDNKTLVCEQIGTPFHTSEYFFCIQIWPDTLAIGKGGSEVFKEKRIKKKNFRFWRQPEAVKKF